MMNAIMNTYQKAIDDIKNSLQEQTNQLVVERRSKKNLSKKDFAEILILCGNYILRKNGEMINFEIKENMKPVINELYLYTIGEKYSINSGFCVCGAPGVGKTVLMASFAMLLRKIGAISGYKQISARTFHKISDKDKYEKGVLFIEEFGKNVEIVKNYGTEEKPMIDLLMSRYETKEITFVDSNFNPQKLNEIYGNLLADRFNQMFTFIEVNGKSLR